MYEDDPKKHLFELIAGIHIRSRRLIQDRLAPLNLTYPQFGALVVLSRTPGMSQQELATALHTDSTNAMVICDGLEKKGFISRVRDPADRRRRLLHPSKEALGTLRTAETKVAALMNALGATLDADRVADAVDLLASVFQCVTDFPAEDRAT